MFKTNFHFSALLLFGLLSTQAYATRVEFLAIGTDNIPHGFNEGPAYVLDASDPAANFFQISFIESSLAGEYISEITIDLSAGGNTQAFFDPSDGNIGSDTNNGGGKGFGPVIGSLTSGITPGDISFSLNTQTAVSPILSIFFADDSFAVNDVFSFGIDIDRLGPNLNNQAGGLLGSNNVGIVTTMGNSCAGTVNSTFSNSSRNSSTAEFEICNVQNQNSPQTIPESVPAILFLISVSAFWVSRYVPRDRN